MGLFFSRSSEAVLAVHVAEDAARAVLVDATAEDASDVRRAAKIPREGRSVQALLGEVRRRGFKADQAVVDLCHDVRFLRENEPGARGPEGFSASEIGQVPAHEGIQVVGGVRGRPGAKHTLVAILSEPVWQDVREGVRALDVPRVTVDAPWFALVNGLRRTSTRALCLLHLAPPLGWLVGLAGRIPAFARELHLEEPTEVGFIPEVCEHAVERAGQAGHPMEEPRVRLTHESSFPTGAVEGLLESLPFPAEAGPDEHVVPDGPIDGVPPADLLLPLGLTRAGPEPIVDPLLVFERAGFLGRRIRRVEE